MKKYLTKIIFHINIDKGWNSTQFDEQLRLVHADTHEEALEKALEIGESHEEKFINANGDLVEWKFIGVPVIISLDVLDHGKEIYSSTHVSQEPDRYIHFVKNKTAEYKPFNPALN